MFGELGHRLKGGLQNLLVSFSGTSTTVKLPPGQDLIITPGDVQNISGTGRTLSIKGGAVLASSAGSGGAVTVTGGAGANNSFAGGTVTVSGGGLASGGTAASLVLPGSVFSGPSAVTLTGVGSSGASAGGVTIAGGVASSGDGGAISVTGSNATGGNNGGNVTVTAGSGGVSGVAGAVNITAGAGGLTSGAGGAVTIKGGLPSGGVGGAVNLTGAAGVGTNKAGGNIVLTGGAATGTGVPGAIISATAQADQSYSYQTPATGFSITIASNVTTLILDPVGTLATGTVTMPATPVDGQECRITSSQTITALTVSPNSGQSVSNAPTIFTPSTTGAQGYEFIYRLANTTWYRLQ